MQRRLSACYFMLVCGTLWAAGDPLVGKWKVNPAKSKLTDEMKVEALGGNKYAITFAPGAVDAVVADGTDQPGMRGSTLAVTISGPNNWRVVRKKDGRMMVMGNWTLSGDGKRLTDEYTAYNSDGSTTASHYPYERTAGEAGFIGTWDTVMNVDPSLEVEIQPYEGDVLSFQGPFGGIRGNIKLDGKEYPNPNQGEGSVYSARRIDERSVEITNKFEGKVVDRRELQVSSDLKTLTIRVRLDGQSNPKNVYVFERK